MHRVFSLSIFLIFFLTAKSQLTRYTVWDFRDSLRSAGIDSLIIYSKECTGEFLFGRDSCNWQELYYLMWKANNKFYVKKFELCRRYKIVELDSLKPYQYYFDNKKIIDSEEIKPFAYIEYSKKGNSLTKLENTLEMQYDCFYKFSFLIGSDIIEKKGEWV